MKKLVLALLVAGCASEDRPASPVDMNDVLLVKSRTRLAVCVEIDPALRAEPRAIAAQVRTELAAVGAMHPDWKLAGLDRAAPEVAIGCPGDRLVDEPVDPKGAPRVRATREPSPFRTHVHVLGDALAAKVLGDQPSARTIAELAPIDDHTVVEVSTLLVIRASALGTAQLREATLPNVIGLRALAPKLPAAPEGGVR